MSSLETRKIEPATGTTVTLGAGGDTVLVSANQLKTNTVKDAGGNTLFTSDGAGTLSSVNSAFTDSMIFISSVTASSSATLEFTSGIDSTYNEYVFMYVSIAPASNDVLWTFNLSTNGGSSYAVTKTTAYFRADHSEGGTGGNVAYEVGSDLSGSTAYQPLAEGVGADADQASSGILHLWNPSSTTYVKQFYSRTNCCHNSNKTQDCFMTGFGDTTSAVDAVSFKMTSGNIAAGTIYMYGIS